MTCEQSERLLDAYFDGELDVIHAIEVEEHVRSCASCSRALESMAIIRNSLRAFARADVAPDRLLTATRAKLRKASGASHRSWTGWSGWAGLAAAVAALAIFGVFLNRAVSSRTGDSVAHDVLTSHVRSLMGDHLMDIRSSEQHTVKPWFAGKIDYSPPVRDFAAQGFPLVGGRLDYIASRPRAVLIYKRRQHVINCFVWPENGPDTGITQKTENGFNIKHWRREGMAYWLVSDLNEVELKQMADLMATPASEHFR